MIRPGHFLLSCFFLLVHGLLPAQLPDGLSFLQIGKPEGLSQGEVEAFCRDHLGLLWVGTRNGLNVWDGYDMKVFFHQEKDPHSLSANGVWDISEDPWGDMWVATNAGLNRFDRSTQSFDLFFPGRTNPDSLPLESTMSVLWSSDSVLWIGGYGGVYKLENYHPDLPTDSIRFRCIAWKSKLNAERQPTPLSITEDSDGDLWFSTTSGVIWVDGQTDEVFYLWPVVNEEPIAVHNVACAVVERLPGEYWISLNGAGVVQMSLEECPGGACEGPKGRRPRFRRYKNDPDDPRSLSVDMATYMTVDQEQRLWCGTAYGVCVYNPDTDDFDRLMPEAGNPESIRHQSTYSIYSDHLGYVWIGTREGISYYSPHRKPFRRFFPIPNSDAGLRSNHVESLFQDSKGRLWVSTQKNVSYLDPVTGQFFHYPSKVEESKGTTAIVKHMAEDRKGNIWFSSQRALVRLDPVSGLFTHYKLRPDDFRGIGTRNLFDILVQEDGTLLLGSYEGILKFDPRTETFTEFQQTGNWNCLDLHQDPNGVIWAAGGRELFQFHPETETYTLFKGWGNDTSLLHLMLTFEFHEDRKGRLWLGSENGLLQIDQENQQVISWSKLTDLPGGVFRCIEEDSEGRLWLGTELGVYRLDPETKEVIHFNKSDGLHGNAIYTRCSATLADGSLAFGGEGGFTLFHPDQLTDNPVAPSVVFTDFRVFNASAPIGGPDSASAFFLQEHVSTIPEIQLKHSDQVWDIHFAATDFSSPEQNLYRYRLVGFDEDWVDAGSRRSATYTNLFEGSYVFEVMGTNNDGVWSEQPARVRIHISPPWYRSWWAYSLYVLVAVGLLWWGLRARTAAVRRQERTQALIREAKLEEREKTRARSSRDFHDEAGNRLTKISLYTGLLQQQLSTNQQAGDFLKHIEEHTQNLASGMRDFIWVLDPQQDHLGGTLERLRQFGDQLFADTGIRFVWQQDLEDEALSLRLDVNSKRHLLMIFKEAMHNALKYSGGSSVSFRVWREEDRLSVRLADDGLGFDQDELVRVNGLHNMESRAREMNATLEVESVPGMGTTILLTTEIHPNGS